MTLIRLPYHGGFDYMREAAISFIVSATPVSSHRRRCRHRSDARSCQTPVNARHLSPQPWDLPVELPARRSCQHLMFTLPLDFWHRCDKHLPVVRAFGGWLYLRHRHADFCRSGADLGCDAWQDPLVGGLAHHRHRRHLRLAVAGAGTRRRSEYCVPRNARGGTRNHAGWASTPPAAWCCVTACRR